MAVMPIAVAGKNPGEIFIPALGRSFTQVELTEDDISDSVQQGSGSVSAGTSLKLWDSTTDKNRQHSSLGQVHRISAGEEAAVFRVGVHPRGAFGNTVPTFNDLKKITETGSLELKFNRRVITSGPILKYQSGYGIGGHSDETGVNAFSVGVPSAAAAPTLFVPQQLKDTDDLNGTLDFLNAAWITSYAVPVLDGRNVITVFLRAVIKMPLGK